LTFLVVFTFLIPAVSALCSGAVHSCSSHNGDSALCTASGCNYNSNNNKCTGNHDACSTYSTQSTCELHVCTWTPDNNEGDTSSTSSTSSGQAPASVAVIPRSPVDGDNLRRGLLTILVDGYVSSALSSDIRVSAESDLFGAVDLVNDFEHRGRGVYGANVILGKEVKKGEYAINIKGESSSYDEERIMINFDPTIYINAYLNKNELFKGESIRLAGDISYLNKEPLVNNSLKLSLTASNFVLNKTLLSNQFGRFEDSYLISFAEPEGLWNIQLNVEDKAGNEGSILLTPKVSTPSGVAFYTVTFLSPLINSEFKRGDIVPITVEVKEDGKPVADVVVNFRTLQGEFINMDEKEPGKYAVEYLINPDDPLGAWPLAVQGVKTIKNNLTKAGGTLINLNIRPATLNLVLLNPTSLDFYTGMKSEITAEVKYVDGNKVTDAEVIAEIGNQTIKLLKNNDGDYSAKYLFTDKDVNFNSLRLSAKDIYGNVADFGPRSINVRKLNAYELQLRIFYHNILIRYWYFVTLGLVVLILFTKPLWYRAHLRRILKKTAENQKRTLEMEKDIQRKYFKRHLITREDYEKLILKYREQASELEEKMMKTNNKLHPKKPVLKNKVPKKEVYKKQSLKKTKSQQ